MKYRLIPGTDLRVSVVGLGCWALSGEHWGEDVDDTSGKAAIAASLDAGVTLFDTAPLYGRGHADELLRAALGARMREVTVATKAGARFTSGGHAISDLSPAHLRGDVEASLRRLGVDAIDLLQVHWPCEVGTPLEETLAALVRLREEGKVRHLGLCNYGPAELSRARELAPIVVLQTPMSLVRREYEGTLALCVRELDLGVLAYEPLARGLLSGKFTSFPRFPESDLRRRDPRFWATRFARTQPLVERVRRIAAQLGVPPSALAIAWVCRRSGVTAALAGAKRAAQVAENVCAAELVERDELWPSIDRALGT